MAGQRDPSDGNVKERLAAALHERIVRADFGDVAAVLDRAAYIDAYQLWDFATVKTAPGDRGTWDIEVVTVLAYFHLYRSQALPIGEGERDFHGALALFKVLLHYAPERVPESVRARLT